MTYQNFVNKLNILQNQLSNPIIHQNVTYISDVNTSLSDVYRQVSQSIVIIEGQVSGGSVQGSGFIYNFTGNMVVITNYHVVEGATDVSVTFTDGNAYPLTKILGYDAYSDLAVLQISAPASEYKPIQIISSSTLHVGDPVIAIGGPYGLAGSMTLGIVSALHRTITESMAGGYPIADVIQTSTQINPGNSGGPLLNELGSVVGITTAIVSNAQGLGFAVPSDTILREIPTLYSGGTYKHSVLGATGVDMTYDIAQAMNTNVTYGWLIVTTTGQPALQGSTKTTTINGQNIQIGGDIIIMINQARIRNLNDLSTYLETQTRPSQTINVTVIRNSQKLLLQLTLGSR
ncbi:MAG: hypothetical protein QG670_2209 [Thermoproteota archaeon]|nr:hypothetical protein [Thermoproteota archaeon]